MLAILKRLGRDDSGQALGEYGLMLALVAGFHRLQDLTDDLVRDYPTATLAVVAVVVALVFGLAVSSNRSRI